MADTPATAVASAETAVKADVAKATTVIQTDIAALKADFAALKTRTFHVGTVAFIAAGAFVLGLLAHLL